jgi:hypothetical protein
MGLGMLLPPGGSVPFCPAWRVSAQYGVFTGMTPLSDRTIVATARRTPCSGRVPVGARVGLGGVLRLAGLVAAHLLCARRVSQAMTKISPSHVATRLRRADEVSAGKNIRVTSDARPSDGGRRSQEGCARVG